MAIELMRLRRKILLNTPHIETASGDIATFETASAAPLKGLTVQIEPVQDLHGYDHPWPAGGGANLFGDTALIDQIASVMPAATVDTTAKTVSFNGQTNGTGNKALTSMAFKENTQYTFIGQGSGNRYNIRWLYTDGTYDAPSAVPAFPMAYVSAAGKTVANLIKINNSATNINILYEQSGIFEGVKSAADFTPYSNECPVTGWTGAIPVWIGENHTNLSVGALSNTNGSILEDQTSYRVSDYIDVQDKDTLFFRFENLAAGNRYLRCCVYDANKTFLRTVYNSVISPTSNGRDFVIPAGAAYARVSRGTGPTIYLTTDLTKIPISWENEAGTIYGGSAVYNGDGTWTVTKKLVGVDMGTVNWLRYSNTGYFYADFTAQKLGGELISSQYRVYTGGFGRNPNYTIWNKSFALTSRNIVVNDTRYSSASAFKAAVSGVQLVYERATPITYTITTDQLLTALKGTNNLWADCGPVEAKFWTH